MATKCRHQKRVTVDIPLSSSLTVHLDKRYGSLQIFDKQRTELEISGTLVITCQDCGYYLRWNLEDIDDAPMWAEAAAKKATRDFQARQALAEMLGG